LPTFVLICTDKPKSLDLRMANREAHLAYVKDFAADIRLGGPLLDAAGDMAGSMLVLEAEDRAAAEAFSANDPYNKAGLFQSVDIRPFRPVLGTLV
jgi:uncharacterized protein YciI